MWSSIATGECLSTYYPTNTHCGRLIAYQYGITGAFRGLIGRAATLEDAYLDGISVTHGSPWARQHIWSSAATTGEEGNFQPDMLCKCSNANAWPFSTSFIGNDHFCDTGMATSQLNNARFFSPDPLWDGSECGPTMYQQLLPVQQPPMVLQDLAPTYHG